MYLPSAVSANLLSLSILFTFAGTFLMPTAAALDCRKPIDCIVQSTDSQARTKCNSTSYNDNPLQASSGLVFADTATECVELFKRAGPSQPSGHEIKNHTCGAAYTYKIQFYSKGEPLPVQEGSTAEFVVGGVKLSLQVTPNQYCNVYYPVVDPSSKKGPEPCGGGNAVDTVQCPGL
jgi:hypothetical protein